MMITTFQLSKWRKLPNGYKLVDITVKSGNKIFAPTWEMVTKIKAGEITEQEYIDEYTRLMWKSFNEHREDWIELLTSEENVALACYCSPDGFCHRFLLRNFLKEAADLLNIDVSIQKELRL